MTEQTELTIRENFTEHKTYFIQTLKLIQNKYIAY